MHHSLFPFELLDRPSLANRGGSDICQALRARAPRTCPGIPSLTLLEATVELLREVPWRIRVDHCFETDGDVQLAVVATDLGRDVEMGDLVNAGFFLRNSESSATGAMVGERIFRVVCGNGAIVELEKGQSTILSARSDWRSALARVIERSFSAEGLDRDVAQFRATKAQMLIAPFELLCGLVAQQIITEDEQIAIQEEFDAAADHTFYGIINAVTRVAGRLLERDDWKRAMELERLGGRILRGDHRSTNREPVFR